MITFIIISTIIFRHKTFSDKSSSPYRPSFNSFSQAFFCFFSLHARHLLRPSLYTAFSISHMPSISSSFLCLNCCLFSFFFLGKKRRLLLLPLLTFACRCCCIFSFAQPQSARTSSARWPLANQKLHRTRWRVAAPPSSSLRAQQLSVLPLWLAGLPELTGAVAGVHWSWHWR